MFTSFDIAKLEFIYFFLYFSENVDYQIHAGGNKEITVSKRNNWRGECRVVLNAGSIDCIQETFS
jgi:hypothetical protein